MYSCTLYDLIWPYKWLYNSCVTIIRKKKLILAISQTQDSHWALKVSWCVPPPLQGVVENNRNNMFYNFYFSLRYFLIIHRKLFAMEFFPFLFFKDILLMFLIVTFVSIFISCTVKLHNLEHPQNWMKMAYNQLFRIFLCWKKLLLHAKIINNQNQLI